MPFGWEGGGSFSSNPRRDTAPPPRSPPSHRRFAELHHRFAEHHRRPCRYAVLTRAHTLLFSLALSLSSLCPCPVSSLLLHPRRLFRPVLSIPGYPPLRYKFLRRLLHFKQMDFEFAAWQMLWLCVTLASAQRPSPMLPPPRLPRCTRWPSGPPATASLSLSILSIALARPPPLSFSRPCTTPQNSTKTLASPLTSRNRTSGGSERGAQ